MSMRAKPWAVPDGLWQRIEPLLPVRQRRFRYPGRKPLDDRQVLQGILFVLHTGIGWSICRKSSALAAASPLGGGFAPGTDRGYDHDKYRSSSGRGVKPIIARRQIEHGSGLGRHRWVVERTFAWLHNRRRLLIRTDRGGDIHEGFLALASAVCGQRGPAGGSARAQGTI
jgi:transposase